MKGLQVFLHSLRQVTGNFAQAVRISIVPYSVQFVSSTLLLGTSYSSGQADPAEIMRGGGGMLLLLSMINLIVVLLTSIWAAVAWHRFVLKGEMPNGFIPTFRADRIWAYFARSFGIGLLCIVLALPFGMIGGMVAMPFMSETGPTGTGLLIVFLVTYFPITVISYRLSTALPATALDASSAFSSGWEATKGELLTFVVLALITLVLYFGVNTFAVNLLAGNFALSLIWQCVFGWISVMVGLSVLTTLYGHYIEKRALS
ncbi:MAG: hypothetical protein ACEQSU_15260 [Microgenomates group bacterium]